MKANEAPEKIYITNFDIEALPKDEQLSVHWHEVSTQDTDIEYTRTEAFIEKAVKFLKPTVFTMCLGNQQDADEYIEDFKNYMKGE